MIASWLFPALALIVALSTGVLATYGTIALRRSNDLSQRRTGARPRRSGAWKWRGR